MADVTITALIAAKDQLSAQLAKVRGEFTKVQKSGKGSASQVKAAWAALRPQIAGAAAGIGAAGLLVGKSWDEATKTIVEGTGKTGEELKEMQDVFRSVAGVAGASLGDTATAIADLNTHLGLTGPELEEVARAALKAGVDTNTFGSVASQTGRDVAGNIKLLDQLTVASQNTGVSADQLASTMGKNSARWLAAGGDMEGLIATVVQAAEEFGPAGLRGAMSEIMEEVDKGVIPGFDSLDDQLGDTTGAVERTHKEAATFADRLQALKDRAIALVGPMGNAVGVVGSLGAAVTGLGPAFMAFGRMFLASGPWGWAIAAIAAIGVAIYKFRRQIGDALSSIIGKVGEWAQRFIGFLHSIVSPMAGIVPGMTAIKGTLEKAIPVVVEMTGKARDWADSMGEVEVAAGDAAQAVGGAGGGGRPSLKKAVEETTKAVDLKAKQLTVLRRRTMAWSGILPKVTQNVRELREGLRLTSDGLDNFRERLMKMGPIGQQEGVKLGKESGGSWMSGFGELVSPENIGGTLSRAFEGGGGLKGAIKSLGAQAGATFGNLVGNLVSNIGGSVGTMFAGPLGAMAGQLIGAGVGKLVDWISNIGGPSAEELEARGIFSGMHEHIQNTLGKIPEYNAEVQRLIGEGWSETNAGVVAGFHHVGEQAGVSNAKVSELYRQFQDAQMTGNVALQESIKKTYEGWVEEAKKKNDEIAEMEAKEKERAEKLVLDQTEAYGKAWKDMTGEARGTFRQLMDAIEVDHHQLTKDGRLTYGELQGAWKKMTNEQRKDFKTWIKDSGIAFDEFQEHMLHEFVKQGIEYGKLTDRQASDFRRFAESVGVDWDAITRDGLISNMEIQQAWEGMTDTQKKAFERLLKDMEHEFVDFGDLLHVEEMRITAANKKALEERERNQEESTDRLLENIRMPIQVWDSWEPQVKYLDVVVRERREGGGSAGGGGGGNPNASADPDGIVP